MNMNMTAFEQYFNSSVFKGYVEEKLPEFEQMYILQNIFPVETVDGLDFSYLKSVSGAVELSTPSAYDAEPIAQHRRGFDAMKGDIPLFRKKMNMSEKEKSSLKMYLAAQQLSKAERIITQIYNDQATLVQGALATQEYLRAKALIDGKINIESKGGVVSFDYGVPSGNKKTLSGDTDEWDNKASKPLDNIVAWCDEVETNTGVRPTRMIMNRKTFNYLKGNDQIKGAAFPMGAINVPINTYGMSDAMVIEAIKAATGLTEIIIYSKKVQMDGKLLDLIPDDKVAIFPEGELGKTLVGTSPAELNMEDANKSGANISVLANGIAVNTYTDVKAPYTSGTEVEFVSIPSLPMANSVILATVHTA